MLNTTRFTNVLAGTCSWVWSWLPPGDLPWPRARPTTSTSAPPPPLCIPTLTPEGKQAGAKGPCLNPCPWGGSTWPGTVYCKTNSKKWDSTPQRHLQVSQWTECLENLCRVNGQLTAKEEEMVKLPFLLPSSSSAELCLLGEALPEIPAPVLPTPFFASACGAWAGRAPFHTPGRAAERTMSIQGGGNDNHIPHDF